MNIQRLFFFLCTLLQFHTLLAYEKQVSVAAIFRDDAPYLKEWIDYHRSIGVEYFWLYNDISEDNWKEVLQPYIDAGIAEVIDWADCREKIKVWPTIQIEAYRHAIAHAAGKTKWLALIDTDEFILPMKNTTLQKCLTTYFPQAHAIYAQWRVFGTNGIWLEDHESMLRKLTACSDKNHPWSSIGKSIVRPEYILTDKIWYNHHFPLADAHRYRDGSGNALPMVNHNLFPPAHTDKYLRINHYFFRDEKFYRETKIARKLSRNMSILELTELHQACSKKQDYTIFKLIEQL